AQPPAPPAAQPPRAVVQAGHFNQITVVAFSPDGKLVATGSDDKTAKVWHVTTGKLINTLSEQRGAVYAVTFSPDGKEVATGGSDGAVWVSDATNPGRA